MVQRVVVEEHFKINVFSNVNVAMNLSAAIRKFVKLTVNGQGRMSSNAKV